MRKHTLIPEHKDPFLLFSDWFSEAKLKSLPQYEAMVLSTVDEKNQPHARVVLLKNFIQASGEFWFFTNYQSNKSLHIEGNSHGHLLFYWEPFGRQVRIQGEISKLGTKESDEYFYSRPFESQVGATVSEQSRRLDRYTTFVERFEKALHQAQSQKPTRPDHWGGFCLKAHSIEYWLEGAHRLHERLVYQPDTSKNQWSHFRLWP